jgi:hypothetical protein
MYITRIEYLKNFIISGRGSGGGNPDTMLASYFFPVIKELSGDTLTTAYAGVTSVRSVLVEDGIVTSVNGQTGAVTLTFQGSTGEIEIIGSGNSYTIGLPNNVTIGGTLNIQGNLNISGYVISDGVIISKTGFQGFTGDGDLEFVDDISLDGGNF